MATEVLHPQDCLIHRFTLSPVTVVHPCRKNYRPTARRSPVKRISDPRRSGGVEELRRKRRSNSNGDDSYAGSAVVQSPSPRSLPLPSFFNRKPGSGTGDEGFDDSATKHLRSLLRLDQLP